MARASSYRLINCVRIAQFRHCLTHLPPTRKIPGIRKARALSRLDRLNRAIAAFEKNALVVLLLDQRESIALRAQACEALDEFVFVHAQEAGDRRNLILANPHKARPAAAVRAALAAVVDGGGHRAKQPPSHTQHTI